jgi:two-component system response regulator QseB
VKILLIEDDFPIGDGIKRGLGHDGMSVDWVRTKEDATSATTAHKYDLIILDIRLPDGSRFVDRLIKPLCSC